MRKKLWVGLILALVWWLRPSRADSPVRTIQWGGRERSYRLHVPPRLGEHPALVVALHGGGGTALQFERFTHFDELADQQGFVVIFPEGVDKGWNDGREGEFNAAHQQNVDDVGFLRAAVAEVCRDYAVDSKRIYATGMSNGGFMASRLGAEASDVFCAIAPVVAGLPGSVSSGGSPLSVLVMQGTEDPLVPYGGGFVSVLGRRRGQIMSSEEAVRHWCEVDGCGSSPESEQLPDLDPRDGCRVTRFRYVGGRQGTEVEFWRVDGGGHTWPGAAQYLPRRLIGRVCRDFDATEEIWRFFSRHPRRE